MSKLSWGLYNKAFISAGVNAATVAITAVGDGLSAVETIVIISAAIAGFIGVWAVPTNKYGAAGKNIAAVILAGLSALGATIAAGPVTAVALLNIFLAMASAGGFVGVTTNAATDDPVINGELVPVDRNTLVGLAATQKVRKSKDDLHIVLGGE